MRSKELARRLLIGSTLGVALAACGQLETENPSSLHGGSPTTCPSNVAWQSFQTPQYNGAVFSYANANNGRQVGNGECSDLPHLGLQANGLKTFTQLGPTGSDADYIWGARITTLSTANRSALGVLPGDVIQYRNFSQKVTEPNGSWWNSSAAHHSSVVKSVSGDGKHICVFEQNINGRRTVATGYINLNGIQSGTLAVFRPIR